MSEVIDRVIVAGAGSLGRRDLTVKRALAALARALGLVAAATFGVRYWEVGRFQVETDDAYVQADFIIIAPRVPGYIAEVLVDDNQPVKAGQVLARIDDRDLRTALDQAVADREAAGHKVANLAAQLQLQQSLIDEAAAQVASAEAATDFAAQDQQRYSDLAHTGAGSIQQAQRTQTRLLQRTADVRHAHAERASAQQQVEVLRTAAARRSRRCSTPARSSSRRA